MPGRSLRRGLRSASDAGWPQEPTQTFLSVRISFQRPRGGTRRTFPHFWGKPGRDAPFGDVRRRPRSTFVTEGRGADFSGRRSPCQQSFFDRFFERPAERGPRAAAARIESPSLGPAGVGGRRTLVAVSPWSRTFLGWAEKLSDDRHRTAVSPRFRGLRRGGRRGFS